MNTKEAIEKLNYGSKVFETDSILEIKILDIIELLKRGEKYEAIVNEIDERLIPGKGVEYDSDEIAVSDFSTLDFIKLIIKDVKQKYFPKPIKKTISIEIEGDNKELIEANCSIIEDYLNNYKKNSSSASILKFTITKGGSR